MKWVPYWNVTPKTRKLLEENTGNELLDISVNDKFLDVTTKAKINQDIYIKVKSIMQKAKTEAIHKMKRQPRAWKKISVTHTSDKGLVSKIYKELVQ